MRPLSLMQHFNNSNQYWGPKEVVCGISRFIGKINGDGCSG